MHRDIVFEFPPAVEQLGHSPRCKVQGMYIPRKLITVQAHPEFNQEIVTEVLETRHKLGIFDDGAYAEYMARVGNEHDGVLVAGAFLKFMLEGR
jgi:GMP synthase-like glutamine amidotransferase